MAANVITTTTVAVRTPQLTMKEAFHEFPRRASWGRSVVGVGLPSRAGQGNFLEAINLCLNECEVHFLDRALAHMGQHLIVVSAGNAVFEVDSELTLLTTRRMMDNGIGCDLVCVNQAPLHMVPLFVYTSKLMKHPHATAEPKDRDMYTLPRWLHTSFFGRGPARLLPPYHRTTSQGMADLAMAFAAAIKPVRSGDRVARRVRTQALQDFLLSSVELADMTEPVLTLNGDYVPGVLYCMLERANLLGPRHGRVMMHALGPAAVHALLEGDEDSDAEAEADDDIATASAAAATTTPTAPAVGAPGAPNGAGYWWETPPGAAAVPLIPALPALQSHTSDPPMRPRGRRRSSSASDAALYGSPMPAGRRRGSLGATGLVRVASNDVMNPGMFGPPAYAVAEGGVSGLGALARRRSTGFTLPPSVSMGSLGGHSASSGDSADAVGLVVQIPRRDTTALSDDGASSVGGRNDSSFIFAVESSLSIAGSTTSLNRRRRGQPSAEDYRAYDMHVFESLEPPQPDAQPERVVPRRGRLGLGRSVVSSPALSALGSAGTPPLTMKASTPPAGASRAGAASMRLSTVTVDTSAGSRALQGAIAGPSTDMKPPARRRVGSGAGGHLLGPEEDGVTSSPSKAGNTSHSSSASSLASTHENAAAGAPPKPARTLSGPTRGIMIPKSGAAGNQQQRGSSR